MDAQTVAQAYDAIAADYDRQVEGDAWMRRALWDHYGRVFRSGDHVLDVGCGTGTDAIFLAQHGVRVTAIDISPGMIARARSKLAKLDTEGDLSERVTTAVLDLNDLAAWLPSPDDTRFDGIISSFAVLNTVPDIERFATDAARLLRPNSHVILHLLGTFSLWEAIGAIARGDWGARCGHDRARTDSRRQGWSAGQPGTPAVRTFEIGGQPVRHSLPRSDEICTIFTAHGFRLCRAYGLGIFRPPHTVRRVPQPIVETLGSLDHLLGSYRPFMNRGRFNVLDFER